MTIRHKNWGHSRVVSLSLLLVAVVLGGCATPPKPYDYAAFRAAKPATLLLLPPVNSTPDVLATPSVLAQMTYPLAESGFYVLPVSLVDETLKANGIQTANDAQQIPREKLRSIFGADAAVYVDVKRYGSVYQVIGSDTTVALEAKVVDLRSGDLLWEGSAIASSSEQSSSNQAGLIGLLVKAVVEQIVSTVTERSHPIAGIASQRLLAAGRPNGMLPGPRSPNYGKPAP